jgi:uncharacterized protein YprB with RNaseH-like and TPR domain
MATLVFDIETIGENWGAMDETTQDVLTRWIRKESGSDDEYQVRLTDLQEGLGFSPLTGSIVAIGMHDVERNRGAVYFSAPDGTASDFTENEYRFRVMDEKTMLQEFWRGAQSYDTFVTFNGRAFDAPFLAIRSAVHGIHPSVDLLSNRYLSLQRGCKHVDLADQLSFYGASRFRGASLHMFCRAFGIESPKVAGVSGDDVAGLYQAGEFAVIARYNARDIRSTAELYQKWRETLS